MCAEPEALEANLGGRGDQSGFVRTAEPDSRKNKPQFVRNDGLWGVGARGGLEYEQGILWCGKGGKIFEDIYAVRSRFTGSPCHP